ncbi:MAG: TfpX/TfpZ family type IV pilin accessory protein [Gammaproteobacteria bacterium]
MKMNLTRKKAFLAHFCLSALVVLTVLTVILSLWYPGPFFQIVGAFDAIKILIGVDLVLGPLLTLILFKPGKWGLKFDMGMVATIQLAALVYGVHTLYIERPYYAVFMADRFEILAERDVDKSKISNDAFLDKPWNGPIFVVAEMPADQKERSKITEEIFFEGGRDVHRRPELWQPYAEAVADVARNAKPLQDLLQKRPDLESEIKDFLEKQESYIYIPVMGRKDILTMVLDAESLKPIDVIHADPWDKAQVTAGRN